MHHTKKYSLHDIFQEVKKYKKELIIANIIAVLAVLVSTPIPLLIPMLVDEVLLQKPSAVVNTINSLFSGAHDPYFYVAWVLALTVFLRLLFFLFSVLQTKLFTIISKNITYKIRRDLLGHISKTSLSEYETFGGANISSLMVVDVTTIDNFLGTTISRLIISVLTIIGVGAVLFMIHWQLALFIMLLNPFVVFLTTKIARKVSKLKKQENKRFELFQEALNETLDLFWQVKASNQEKRFIATITEKAENIKDASIAFDYKSDAATRFSFLIFLTGFEIFRATGILMVAYSDLTIGLMLAIFGYLWVIMTPVQELLNIQYAYHNAKAALERINKIFAMEKEPDYPHLQNPFHGNRTNAIELKNVCFHYDNDKNILNNISMNIEKGSKVALIGASGSGKTTLAQIIVGFYPLSQGELLFDGINVKEIGLDIVRENVFLVLQNPQLFNDTIKMNLTFGKEVDNAVITKALKVAQLEEFVAELDHGIDTVVGKNGIKLSGGQRQRLSIARMIIADPNIVILDESTSALDVYTEENLFKELSEFLKERTTIIIAHRLSTIRKADYIYVLDKGAVEEEGTQQELMEKEGVFVKFMQQLTPRQSS